MAQLYIFSLILIVISVNSQQYGYPYQTGYQYPENIYQYPINQDNTIYQYPVQAVNQPENSIYWYPQAIQPPNQDIGYGSEKNPINYYPHTQNYPHNSYYPVVQQRVNEAPKQQKQDKQKLEPVNLPNDPKTDIYANVPTEIIDVDPENFNRIMQRLHVQPRIISYETRVRKTRLGQPQYKVTTETKKSNHTNVPQSIQRHEVINKSYSFNKTYVLHPGQDRKEVINLNFVNGVQVTDNPENIEDGADEYAGTTSDADNEQLRKAGKKFIDVPEGCEEGDGFSATGGCFSPFKLHINETDSTGTDTNNSHRTTVRTTLTTVKPRRHYGAHY